LLVHNYCNISNQKASHKGNFQLPDFIWIALLFQWKHVNEYCDYKFICIFDSVNSTCIMSPFELAMFNHLHQWFIYLFFLFFIKLDSVGPKSWSIISLLFQVLAPFCIRLLTVSGRSAGTF
jgi:hypothetical protein